MSFEKVLGVVLFSAIGFAFYTHAKKRPSFVTLICAIFLMSYSYFLDDTWQIYLWGTSGTCIPPLFHFWKNR